MSKRKGHGVGKDSVSISTSIPIEIDKELRRLAAKSALTRGGYARAAIMDAVAQGFGREVSPFRDRTTQSTTYTTLRVAEPKAP